VRICLKSIKVANGWRYNKRIEIYLRKVDREIGSLVESGGKEIIKHTVQVNTSSHIAIIHSTLLGFEYTLYIMT